MFQNFKKTQQLNPEDIFADPEAIGTDSLESPLNRKKIIGLYVVIFFVLAVLFLRTWQIQFVQGEKFRILAQNNQTRLTKILPERGIIYDKNLNQLVKNKTSFDLAVIPRDLPKDEADLEKLIQGLSDFFEWEIEDISQKIKQTQKSNFKQIILKSNIPRDQALFLDSQIENFPGLQISKNLRRYYLFDKILSHILGYTGKITQKELEKCLDCSILDYAGKAGLELVYQEFLRGQAGLSQEQVDANGRVKHFFIKNEPEPGYDLVLHLDLELQKQLYFELLKALEQTESKKGAAIILDPRNGGVLALVSLPAFSSNLMMQGLSSEDYADLVSEAQPLFNRVISGEYAPGSTIKPFIAAAALEENIIDPLKRIEDKGYIQIHNQYNPDIVYTFSEVKSHGLINMIEAISHSCNIYFYTIAGGYKDIKGLGIKKIKQYAEKFGFNNLLQIDLPGESKGLIPDQAWKKKVKGESWFLGDTYHSAIGQGDVTATPLQLAAYTSVIASGGVLYQPQIVDKMIIQSGEEVIDIEPKVIRKNFIDPKNLKIVQSGMEKILEVNFGWRLRDLKVKVAGKTGTAEIGGTDKTHAWFTSYAPVESPELVITVLIEQGGFGSSAALPVAKNIYEWYYKRN